jgi:hypothetical protein
MNDIIALVVPADMDAEAYTVSLAPTHDTFVGLVEDVNTDTVFFADGAGAVKVSANSKSLTSHEPNPRATQVLERFLPGFAKRDRVEGPAVFVGIDDEGDFGAVPDAVLAFASNFFPVVARGDQ